MKINFSLLWYHLCFGFIILLATCQDTKSISTDGMGINHTLATTARVEGQEIMGPPIGNDTTLQSNLALSNTPQATQIIKPTPTPKIKTVSPPFVICSPLQGFALEELPEIVSAPYAPPPPGREERHHGVDFSFYQRGEWASIEGVGVQTVLAGRVAAAIWDRFPYGNMVIIETPSAELSAQLVRELQAGEGESLYLLYAHMADEPEVEIGAVVPACFPLGSVGKSGNAGVAHLHFEARMGPAEAQFPGMAFYLAQTTQEERDNYTLWRTSGVFRHFDPLNLLTQSAH